MLSTASSALSAQTLEGNRLLALLDSDTRQRMLPALTLISYELGRVLYEPNRVITHIYFPLTAVTSVLSEMTDGTTVEVATVGREGMVGLPIFLGDETTFLRTIAQIPGTALSMGRIDFLNLVEDKTSGLRRILLRYTQALFSQLAQQSACNRSHNMEERCARWILMTQDRVGHDEFPLTQEFLAFMLGARRASVTLAAGILARAGLIQYTRGKIQVLDRGRLEEATCECYGIIQREYERLIGKAERKTP
jgi:CRP-like cAMP-binding protein